MTTRRDFIKKTVAGTAALSLEAYFQGLVPADIKIFWELMRKYVSGYW